MRSVAGLPVRGPVRTCRHEHAEWDRELGDWQAPRGVTIVTFRPDGQVSEGASRTTTMAPSRWAHTYDDEGRLVEVQSWTNDRPKSCVLHAYDSTGRPTTNTHVAADGTRREIETYAFDSAGRKTTTVSIPDLEAIRPMSAVVVGYGIDDDADEGLFYDTNHRLIHRIARSRDQDGRVLREIVELGGETPFGDFQGDLGRVPVEDRATMAALVAQLFANRTFASVEYEYDQRGRILERMMRMGSLSEERTIYQYGDRDDPIEEISEHHSRSADIDDGGVVHTKEETPRGQHTRYRYQYDDHGNWTERITSSRIDPQAAFQRSVITRRTITYYG